MKIFALVLLALSIAGCSHVQAQNFPTPTPDFQLTLQPGFTKAIPKRELRFQCQIGYKACIHHGGVEWFELGEHSGNVYLEVFGGAYIGAVYRGGMIPLEVEIQNAVGFDYEGTRYAYISGIPTDLELVLVSLAIPGYGPADFGAR